MEYKKLVKAKLNRVEYLSLLVLALVAAGFAVIGVRNVIRSAFTDALIMFVIAGVTAWLFVMALPGQKFRSYCRQVEKLGDAEEIFRHVETMACVPAAGDADLRVDESYIAYVGENSAAIGRSGDLVWGHLHQTTGTRRIGVVPIGTVKTRGVMLRFVDRSEIFVEIDDRDTALAVLDDLKARFSYMMLGYNPQLEAVYNKDPRELWSAAGYQNQQS